ncbi:MAG: H-NS histone family protein [Proteobacteria bacterium]|nr:H-NS histone family protein [Pseudomonadota bacterium]MBS0573285.1 H-NS histone family protein [Pseudomonadota bacterium]
MKIDLDSMSLKELRDLHAQTARAIASFVDRKKQQAISALEEQAKSLGFSLNELVGAAPARKRRPARAKYANPANAAETWTGRGRKPRWMEAALKTGRSLESMLIK